MTTHVTDDWLNLEDLEVGDVIDCCSKSWEIIKIDQARQFGRPAVWVKSTRRSRYARKIYIFQFNDREVISVLHTMKTDIDWKSVA